MKKGTTRIIIPIGNYVIKIPKFYNVRCILKGMLSNLQERSFRHLAPALTAKIPYADIFGFVLIMERADYIPQCMFRDVVMFFDKCEEAGLPVERKPENVGVIRGCYKLLDFGTCYGAIHSDNTKGIL